MKRPAAQVIAYGGLALMMIVGFVRLEHTHNDLEQEKEERHVEKVQECVLFHELRDVALDGLRVAGQIGRADHLAGLTIPHCEEPR